jgi:hypothetical protein
MTLEPPAPNGTWAFIGDQFIRAIFHDFNSPTSLSGNVYNAVEVTPTTAGSIRTILSFDFTFTTWVINPSQDVMIFQEPVTPAKSVFSSAILSYYAYYAFLSSAAVFHFYDLRTGSRHSLRSYPMAITPCQPLHSLRTIETYMTYCSDDSEGDKITITVVNWTNDNIISVRSCQMIMDAVC